MDTNLAISYIAKEFKKACKAFPPFHSNHEAYGVIKEEFDELWHEIMRHQDPFTSTPKMGKEAIQLAATALRFLVDRVSTITSGGGGRDATLD